MSGYAIRADSPWFFLRRNRPLARGRRQRWRRNRTSNRVSWSTSIIFSATLTTLREEDRHARNTRTKCRLGGVATVMCPVAFCIQAERKPTVANYLSDVAVSAESPLLRPRQNRPLGRTEVTSAKKLSEALRRQRRRCVFLQRKSPSRRRETNAPQKSPFLRSLPG